jgi:adiponectin receptor
MSSASPIVIDAPMLAYTIFALFTLFSSVVWHTMAGCAHHRGMVLCAKIDYVGIAWYVYVPFALVFMLKEHNYVLG